jgi:hypothetical protein
MRGEPEAVSEEEQGGITRAVRFAERERLLREWRRTSAAINAEPERRPPGGGSGGPTALLVLGSGSSSGLRLRAR